MPSVPFGPDRPRRRKAGAGAVIRATHSNFPWGGTCSGSDARILVANQNLLHLVFKCLMNTKHSGQVDAWQALFDAQNAGPKTTAKTAFCAALSYLSNVRPPTIHRLVHNKRSDGRRWVCCRYATAVPCPPQAGNAAKEMMATRADAGRRRALRQHEQSVARHRDAGLAAGARDQRKPGQPPERREERAAPAEDEAGHAH